MGVVRGSGTAGWQQLKTCQVVSSDCRAGRVQETKGAQLGIRSAKMKEARMRAEGMGGSRAGKAATGADKKSSKPKKKRARRASQLHGREFWLAFLRTQQSLNLQRSRCAMIPFYPQLHAWRLHR